MLVVNRAVYADTLLGPRRDVHAAVSMNGASTTSVVTTNCFVFIEETQRQSGSLMSPHPVRELS